MYFIVIFAASVDNGRGFTYGKDWQPKYYNSFKEAMEVAIGLGLDKCFVAKKVETTGDHEIGIDEV